MGNKAAKHQIVSNLRVTFSRLRLKKQNWHSRITSRKCQVRNLSLTWPELTAAAELLCVLLPESAHAQQADAREAQPQKDHSGSRVGSGHSHVREDVLLVKVIVIGRV